MTVDGWRVKYEILSAENDKLRVLLATSNANCAFCGLPAAEMAKCASGFPGCSRADDMILCVHPTRQDLLDEVERLREDAARNRWCEEMKADVNYGFHSGGVYVHEWFVQWDGIGTAHDVRHPDRNAAIDAARGYMKAGKVGIRVTCGICGRTKQPHGRSAPMASSYCDSDCEGYNENPRPGCLWPGETDEDFEYPCCDAATRPVGQCG